MIVDKSVIEIQQGFISLEYRNKIATYSSCISGSYNQIGYISALLIYYYRDQMPCYQNKLRPKNRS